MNKNKTDHRRLKHGSMAILMTVGFVIAVILVNVVATLLLERFPVNIDLTDKKMFQLTDESKEFIKNLNEPVTITVCANEETFKAADKDGYYRQANEILNEYPKYNSKIKLNYVDLVKDPGFAQKYADYSVSAGNVIVETEKRIKVFDSNDFFQQGQSQVTGAMTGWSKAEQVMTSAIMYTTDEKISKASVLQGHSEKDVANLISLMQSNNFEIVNQNITTETIDPDASILLICAPSTDYTPDELKKIDEFLSNGGELGKSVFYIASNDQPSLPNLEGFLREWGINLSEGTVAETDSKNIYTIGGQPNPFVLGVNYVNSKYTEGLKQPDQKFIAYNARPVSLAFEAKDNRTASLLLESPQTSILVPLDAGADFDVNSLKKQPYGVAAIGQQTDVFSSTYATSSVVVMGSEQFYSQIIMNSAQFNNGDYSINLINQISGKQETLNIPSISFEADSFTVTASQSTVVLMIFMILIPVVFVSIGIVVSVRRRNR